MMRSRAVLAMIAVVYGGFFSLAAFAADPLPAPPLILPSEHGQMDLATLKGRVVYLDFWASWCGPCRKSFPWMSDMQARYGSQGLTIVAVNLDQDHALAAKFLAAYPPGFTVAFDPKGATAERYDVKGMPSSYLIDRAGRIQARHIGFREQDAAALEQEIRALLKSETGR
jgi:thiol-disulfide isomerase/thioredoxin